MEIVTLEEIKTFLRIDYDNDDVFLTSLIQLAYDMAQDSIDNFSEKLNSSKFKRKLKLFMLNTIVSMYDDRGITASTAGESKEHKLKYINQTMLLQLQYGTYLETDL